MESTENGLQTKRLQREQWKTQVKDHKASGEDLEQIEVQQLGIQSPVIDASWSQTLIIQQFTL